MAFTDGTSIGAVLDRNGLRPSRYWVTKSGLVVMASEAGVLGIPPEEVESKGRLRPAACSWSTRPQGRIIADDEIKQSLASRTPVSQVARRKPGHAGRSARGRRRSTATWKSRCSKLQRTFGYTLEDLRILMAPMATDGNEAIGSMGNDTPLAVLSDRPQLLYNYFKQLFAQVTNPPLDAIREEIITSLVTTIGSEGNLLDETPEQCRLLRLEQPILTNAELEQIRQLDRPASRAARFPRCFPRSEGIDGMRRRMDELRAEASQAIADGVTLLILSDRGVNARDGADSGAVGHQRRAPSPGARRKPHALRTDRRNGRSPRSASLRPADRLRRRRGESVPGVRHAAADARRGHTSPAEYTYEKLEKNYIKAIGKGLLKVMSKMGISTQHSYRGAQIFEAIGLNSKFVDEFFTRTASRIEGVGIEAIAEESLRRHEHAYPAHATCRETLDLDVGGQYQWRRKGEAHIFSPEVIAKLQHSTRLNSREEFRKFCQLIDDQQRQLLTLRGLLEFKPADKPIPLEEVEPAAEIVKRFATGAMSYGSISREAHETLAIAMNRIGGKSNTGEGGEDPARFQPDAQRRLAAPAPSSKWPAAALA